MKENHLGNDWKEIIWGQFGAAIDMLENAIKACPEEVWGNRSLKPEFWYTAYHALFFIDFYLSEKTEGFTPPPPFSLSELDTSGVLPERVYSKEELLTYLLHGRNKCRTEIDSMTDEKGNAPSGFDWLHINRKELLLYNMRHVQHHAAQLNMLLRQNIDSAPRWVRRTKKKLINN